MAFSLINKFNEKVTAPANEIVGISTMSCGIKETKPMKYDPNM